MIIKSLIVVIGILFFLSLEYLFPKEKIEFKEKLSLVQEQGQKLIFSTSGSAAKVPDGTDGSAVKS